MLLLKLLSLFVFILFSTEAASLSERDPVFRENKLLKAEYRLATTRQIYVVFMPIEKKIQIKASGAVLKELPLEYFKLWGHPSPLKNLMLIKKTGFFKPKRTMIKPKENDEVNPSELNALEIDEMPVRYCLRLEDGVWLYIRPIPEGVISRLFNIFSSLKSYMITKPIVTIWNALHGKTFTEIYIYLNPKDAKSLYWVFIEGTSCIVYDI